MAEKPSEVVYEPPQRHRCQIVPDIRNYTANLPGGPITIQGPAIDPPGTVRRCGDCGATWVAYRPPTGAGYAPAHVEWRREGWLARWWRNRRRL